MNTPYTTLHNQKLQDKLDSFITQYGELELEKALDIYMKMNQVYTCKTKTSLSRICISDINYLRIEGHHIAVHTSNGIYHKYGSLNQELEYLSSYGFFRCSQNCIVSISKISSIEQNKIILLDNTVLHISRNNLSKLIMAFNGKN